MPVSDVVNFVNDYLRGGDVKICVGGTCACVGVGEDCFYVEEIVELCLNGVRDAVFVEECVTHGFEDKEFVRGLSTALAGSGFRFTAVVAYPLMDEFVFSDGIIHYIVHVWFGDSHMGNCLVRG